MKMNVSLMGNGKPIIKRQITKGYNKVQHLCRKAKNTKPINVNPALKDCIGYFDVKLDMWVYRWYCE